MAGLGPLRQVTHLSGRVPVLEGPEPSQLTPHHSGRPEELTTTDWSYSSPKPEAAPGRLHLATVLPRDMEASPGNSLPSCYYNALELLFFFASNSSAKNIKAGRRSQVCGGGARLSLRVLSRTWQLFLLDLDMWTEPTNGR